MEPTGANVTVDLSLSLDAEVGFVRLRWRDRVSEPFTGWLDVVTPEESLDPADLLHATVGLTIRGDGRRVQHLWSEVDRAEHRGAQRGLATYRLRLRPELARLALRRGTRTFTELSVDDVVAELLAEHGVARPLVRVERSFPARALVAQRDETDLDFVRRLLGEQPIWWHVAHDASGHRLVITDRPTNRRRKLPIIRTAADGDGLLTWVVAAELDPDGTRVTATGRATTVGIDVGEVVNVVDEGGDGGAFHVVGIDLLIEAHEDEPPTTDRAPAELIADLEALPVDTTPNLPAVGPGPSGLAVTATVVGPPGETVFVDDLGRVRVDLPGPEGGASSTVWVPVVQPWAGSTHGTAYWPRVGDRVWVEFEEGDPSRPVVTGSLYTDDAPPPVALPVGKRRTIVTSAAGGLELDDTPGHEQVIIEAARGLSIAVDQDLVIDGRNDGTVGVDGRLVVEADQELVLRCGAASITLQPDGEIRIDGEEVRLDGEKIVLSGSSSIDLTSPNVTGT